VRARTSIGRSEAILISEEVRERSAWLLLLLPVPRELTAATLYILKGDQLPQGLVEEGRVQFRQSLVGFVDAH